MAHRIDSQRHVTLAQYQALPDDDRFLDEVSRGLLLREPAPGDAHARLVTLLAHRLMQHLEEHPGGGRVYSEGGFILNDEPLTVRRPDVAFVRAERVPRGYEPGIFHGAPDLAIEVVSSGNRAGDLLRKVSELLEAGSSAVWVVDPARENVVIHDQSGTPRVLRAPERVTGADVLPGFALELDALFRDY